MFLFLVPVHKQSPAEEDFAPTTGFCNLVPSAAQQFPAEHIPSSTWFLHQPVLAVSRGLQYMGPPCEQFSWYNLPSPIILQPK